MNKFRNFFFCLTSPYNLPGWWADILHFIPRMIGGLALTLDFGSSKFGMPWSPADRHLALFEVIDWFVRDVSAFGFPFNLAPGFFAWIGAASEAIGGALIVLGLQTRVAGFFLCCTMITAIFFQKWEEGLWGMLPAMGFLWIGIYCVILGSGKLGIDYLTIRLFKSKKT